MGFFLLLIVFRFQKRSNIPIEPIPIANEERQLEAVAALGQLSPLGDILILAAPITSFGSQPRVSKLLVDEGSRIKEGEVIVIFDNRSKIVASLNVLNTKLETLKSNIAFQEKEVDRYRNLSSKGAYPRALLEEKEDLLVSLKGQKREILAEIKLLEIDLNDSELKSPIDGVVLSIHAREGERPGSDGVLHVGSTEIMEAIIEVYESDISRVNIGQNVSLISENGGFDSTLLGNVSRISPKVRQRKVLSTDPTGDADARIIEVRVKLTPDSSSKVTRFTGMKVIARFTPL